MIAHMRPEFLGFRAQFRVEGGAHVQNVLGRTGGLWIAGTESKILVRKAHGIGKAHALRLYLAHLGGNRHKILLHGLAEGVHIRGVVAVAPHVVIAKGRIVGMTQFSSHTVAQFDQLIVQAVQFFAVLVVPFAFGFPCGAANIVVGTELVGGELGQGEHLTVKRNLRGCNQLGVLADQLVFLLHILHQFRHKAAGRKLCIDEGDRSVLFFKVLAVGAG